MTTSNVRWTNNKISPSRSIKATKPRIYWDAYSKVWRCEGKDHRSIGRTLKSAYFFWDLYVRARMDIGHDVTEYRTSVGKYKLKKD